MEYLHPADGLHPRIESSRVVYPMMQSNPGTNRFFWTSTAHLTADPLSEGALYYLLDRRAWTGRGLFGKDQFVLESIFEDWSYRAANPAADPLNWLLERTHIHRSAASALKCLQRLQSAGWLVPQKAGIKLTPEYDVVARHRTRTPAATAYAKLLQSGKSLFQATR